MAVPMSASEQAKTDAWNSYMNSPASKADPFAPGKGSLWENMPKTAEEYRRSGGPKTLPARQNVFGGGGGGGGYSGGGGGGGMEISAAKPVEFFLGAAPTIPGLDLSGPMSQFRNVFNQLNSGVNPSFDVDQNKLVSDAKSAAARLNMSPSQIKSMIAGINPSTGEIASEAVAASKTLNKVYQDEFESAMPGYKQNMVAANNLTSTYLAGKIPQDVVDQVFRNSAAKGFTTGLLGGGIGRNIVARDLGLTSLQLQTAGANLLQQTANIANSVLASTLKADPGQIFSTIFNAKRVDPTSIFNAVYVPTSQVYSQMSQMAQQSTMARANFEASKMIAPSQVFDVLTTQAQYNQQINAANALNAWQSQPLPGQFDIKKGQYVGFQPGTYSSSKPLPPGTKTLNPEEEFMVDMGGAMVPASALKGPAGQMIVARQRAAMREYAAKQNAENLNYQSVAYRPQLTGFGA